MLRRPVPLQRPMPLGLPADTQNPIKIQQKFMNTNIAKQIATRPANGGPKDPNMNPTSIQNLRKSRSRAGLGRAAGKKHEDVKSIQYLQCFDHIQALSKTLLFGNLQMPNWSWSLSRRGFKNKLQTDTMLISKMSENKLKKDPAAPQDGPKILQTPCFCSGPKLLSSNFWSQGCRERGT